MRTLDTDSSALPGPWQWYVLLAAGHALSGLFSWLMVLWAVFCRGRKREAFLWLTLNLAIFGLLAWYLMKGRMPWWWLSSSVLGINLMWAMSAWLFQRTAIGKAPSRYVWAERYEWISPFVIGLILGIALSVVTGIPEALGERREMQAAFDILDRESVLWILLRSAYKGIPFGMCVGFWWAGERRQFSVSRVITFLSAYCISFVFMVCTGLLLAFVLLEGGVVARRIAGSPEWALTPPWITGWPKWLMQISQHDFSDQLVVPLLFGAAPRIRDFGKRLLWLPAIMVISLPFLYADHTWWGLLQSHIVHDMSSPKEETRAAAYKNAEQLLVRYPEHMQWPRIAEAVAGYRYERGRFDESKTLYRTMVQRFKGHNRWTREVGRAEAALGSSGFGSSGDIVRVDIPMVDYENYLTHNWMALLSVIRYWEGPQATESNVKIMLKPLSKSDDKIVLNPLVAISDLDDAVRNLNYRLVILPSSLPGLKALLSASIPVVLVDKDIFRVAYGFDDSRSAVLAYGFDFLSGQTRQEARKEAKEILALEAEGHGESKDRLDRIRREAQVEYGIDFWQGPIRGYRAPFMAAIVPEAKVREIADTLGRPLDAVIAESDGILSALIGMAFLRHADPVQALEWAKTSSRRTSSNLSLHVGELSSLYWQSREKKVRSRLPFQSQFPKLKAIEQYFDAPENKMFLANARPSFEAALKEGSLPWFCLNALEMTLIPTDPNDQPLLIQLGRTRVALDPSDTEGWKKLAEALERSPDLQDKITALEGLTASDPLNHQARLDLATTLVIDGEFEKAELALRAADPEMIRMDADYQFCLGAIAQWKKKPGKAMKHYKKAIDMRRYKAVYHLHYGRLLLAEGLKEEAEKALRWAATIDATGQLKKEAEKLLNEMKS